ncbi:(d)CMP kinase [Chryseobacterium salipaludis]|uniref:(d)CMP kinase n=1 Tax=Chryseobacterium TaxID=59732 RepID=UPI001FF642C8|nr:MULTISPECIES: (d)CMP kinase [Chryseobacterium]MCJ8496682.1 (d)CMP kinase [Chryseobacterium salipaludis]MCX3296163.1 (d)CMP kinase [Planobacterium sp. JC490]
MKKPVIAVDGYSSTGKSSISKVVAARLGLIHLDTGALYRGITLFALRNFRSEDGDIQLDDLFKALPQLTLEFRRIGEELVLFMNGEDISGPIRTAEVSSQVSLIARQPEVRNFLLKMQREAAEAGGIIMDGRDIGTVVLPMADYKFFLTASIEERTQRRFLELKGLGIETPQEEVQANLMLRDKIDSEREVAPLKQADDAILIDNTSLNKYETIELMLSYIK